MTSHCFSSTSTVCVCTGVGASSPKKQGLTGHPVTLVQQHPSNENDAFPLRNELVLRPHCLVCIITMTRKGSFTKLAEGLLLIRTNVPKVTLRNEG